MYKVVETFGDLQDNNHIYAVGDEFPRQGLTVSKERLEYLASDKTNHGKPVIEEIVEKPKAIKSKKEK
jgi:hypothetical protein